MAFLESLPSLIIIGTTLVALAALGLGAAWLLLNLLYDRRSVGRVLALLGGLAATVGAAFAVATTGFLLLVSPPGQYRGEVRTGQQIVQAIDHYRADTGAYPASLRDLVPAYLPATIALAGPGAPSGTGWEYATTSPPASAPYTLSLGPARPRVYYDPPCWYGYDDLRTTTLHCSR